MKLNKIILTIVILLFACKSYANEDVLSVFPFDHYDQTISTWIKPNEAGYEKPILSDDMQKTRFALFLEHYDGTRSPWSIDYMNHYFTANQGNDIKVIEEEALNTYSNKDKTENEIGFAENFRPYPPAWINQIKANVNLAQFTNLTYQSNQRAITLTNLSLRGLPTNDPHFYSYKLAGQGFPFDNLQESSVWAGSPIYILGESNDHAWDLIVTADSIGWVDSTGVARVNESFVNTWMLMAKQNLAAITKTQTSIINTYGTFLFSAYVGSVFPAIQSFSGLKLLVPVANANHAATIAYANVSPDNVALMPLATTPTNFASIIQTLIGRPYGWGNIYFYNDCSAELKNLLTPFGIWLPRHSSEQVKEGKMVDLSADTPVARLSYLIQHGTPFLTIIYIGNHVVLYIGNFLDQTHGMMAMTYQDVWGLSPKTKDRRAVIGKSVFLPLLLQYPEDPALQSEADKTYFQVSDLSALPDTK